MNQSGLTITQGRWCRWHLPFHQPDDRLARRGGDGCRHVVELAVRRAAVTAVKQSAASSAGASSFLLAMCAVAYLQFADVLGWIFVD
jgi:hypothetical protein